MDSKKNNDFINPILAQIMGDEDPFSWQESLEKVVFRDVENRTTSRVLIGQKPYFVKIHKSAFWQSAFNELFRGQTPRFGAEAEWKAVRAFQILGIPTIEPYLYAKRGTSFLNHQSLLISKALEKKISLEHFSTSNPVFKRQLIKKIAEISRKMQISRSTVDIYRHRARKKMNLRRSDSIISFLNKL